MMDSIALREFLQKKYENPTAFLENVIYPVFGEENYDSSGSYHWLRKHQEDQLAAENAGILDILVLGSLYVDGSQLDIFDVTVASKHQLANNRVGIQQLIRRIISTHSGAFIIFHYKTSDRWDWRFTFCHKGASMDDSTDAKRYTFLLGPGQSCRTAAINFEKIHQTISSTGSFTMKDVIKAFDVEALSDEFFGKYKAQYEKFVSYMADPKNGMRDSFIDTDFDHEGLTDEEICSREEKPLRDYVKKLLGRIVFLYFIQKKGWLGVEPNKDWGEGDMDFMLHLFEKASNRQKANFLDEVLEPLFEGGLNTDRSSNGHLFDTGIKAMPNGGVLKVPYLNGGLFERDATDEPESVFPAEYFDSLLTFLSQYNFTIDENDPNDAQVGIDPEMLGRIFENLLEDNKDKGTFYTPKEIVQYMCRESLIAYLQKDKGEEEKQLIRNFVASYDTAPLSYSLKMDIDQKLKDVKVCDPAIGSGAFPMGILKEIFYCRGAIENFADAARIKKEIINNNLYGVDIEKGAVDIARLRFWLAIVVDEKDPDALPNLDYKVMQGNSLLESYKKVDLSHLMEDERCEDGTRQLSFYEDIIEDTREELTVLQRSYFDCSDHEEKRHIEEDIKTVINTQLSAQRISLDLNEIDNIAANSDFFLWHTWFSDVFSRSPESEKGFDIVIGNPPYGATLSFEIKDIYKKLYSDVHMRTPDTFNYFISNGIRLLKPSGCLSYIVPNTILSQNEYVKARDFLYKSNVLSEVVNIGENVFKEADVPTCIIRVIKEVNPSYSIRYADYKDIDNDKIVWGAGFILLPSSTLEDIPGHVIGVAEGGSEILAKIRSKSVTINDIAFEMAAGISTGCNKAFCVDEEQIAEHGIERGILMPLLKGENIDRYSIAWANEYIIYTTKETEITLYPNAKAFAKVYKEKLDKRRETKKGMIPWWALNWPRYRGLFEGDKIIMRQTSDSIRAVFDDQNFYPLNSILTLRLKEDCPYSYLFVLGVLNSSITNYVYQSISQEKGRAFAEVKPINVRKLYIPKADSTMQKSIERIVKDIMKRSISIDLGMKQIDDILYEYYDIRPEDISLSVEE